MFPRRGKQEKHGHFTQTINTRNFQGTRATSCSVLRKWTPVIAHRFACTSVSFKVPKKSYALHLSLLDLMRDFCPVRSVTWPSVKRRCRIAAMNCLAMLGGRSTPTMTCTWDFATSNNSDRSAPVAVLEQVLQHGWTQPSTST